MIAIRLLQQQRPQTIQTLKDLLTFIPNPDHVKDILTTAVIQLIDTCPRSTLWLFQHPDLLAPEIQVRELITQELTQRIRALGFTSADFSFTADHYLAMNEDAKRAVLSQPTAASHEPVLTLIGALLLP